VCERTKDQEIIDFSLYYLSAGALRRCSRTGELHRAESDCDDHSLGEAELSVSRICCLTVRLLLLDLVLSSQQLPVHFERGRLLQQCAYFLRVILAGNLRVQHILYYYPT
jgi:hypothetical protein